MDDLIREARAMIANLSDREWYSEKPGEEDVVRNDNGFPVAFFVAPPNRRFIAWARNNVPKLIDALEAAEAKVRDMALDVLAASGQAQEAYDAQLKAEARVAELEAANADLRLAGMKAMAIANGALDTTATEKTFRRDLVNIREELRAVLFPARATLAGKE